MADTTETTPPAPDVDLEAGESTPLVSPEEVQEPGPLKEMAAESLKEKAVAGFSAVSFTSSLVSVMIVGGPFVWVSGILGMGMSVYATFQQQKLTQVEALNQTNEFFAKELDRLRENREELNNQVNQMEESVMKLKDTEQTFDRLNEIQGDCLVELEKQLEEQKKIMSMTKNNLQNEVMSNIMDIAINADDGDMMLTDVEVQAIIDHVESLNGVDIKDEKLKQVVRDTGGDIGALMDVLKNLMADDVPEEDKIFVFL